MPNLKALYLNDNIIEQLPAELCQIKSLQVLSVFFEHHIYFYFIYITRFFILVKIC